MNQLVQKYSDDVTSILSEAVLMISEVAFDNGAKEGYKEGYKPGYSDGWNDCMEQLIPAIADGLRCQSTLCAEVMAKRRWES